MNEDILTLEDSIELLLGQVPPPVRLFVLNELNQTTTELMGRHKLHVDQGGVLERELLLMLLGQSTPEDFVQSLKEASLTPEQVKGLTDDVNKEVFMRLREEERKPINILAAPAPKPQQILPISAPAVPPVRASVPIYSPLPSAPAPSAPPAPVRGVVVPMPPKQVPPPANLPGQVPEAPRAPIVPPPHLEVPVPTPTPTESTPAHSQILHTMARDMQALKGGEDPLRVAHPAPPAWAEMRPAAPAKASEVVTPTPVASQLPVEPSHALPAHDATHEHEVVAPHPQEALRTHLKQYGVDPYREPVE